ncbi:MAG TPA: winged helix-turn-helix domain-containing protein [Kineosporiaceae bacterium]|nr:winged helix-turn-helix domain-containing protein [Kineosporiaceae bacterium]
MAASVLHEVLPGNAVPVSLSAARRPAQRAAIPDRAGVVIQLGTDVAPEPTLDAGRLARAVEDLIRAVHPSLAGARVEVQLIQVPDQIEERAEKKPKSHGSAGTKLDLDLDLAGRTLTVDGRVRTLTRREFDLLAYLQNRRGVALSRRELMSAVWQTGYLVGDRTIDVHVRRLRVKLGRHADRLSTLRGYGYRLD